MSKGCESRDPEDLHGNWGNLDALWSQVCACYEDCFKDTEETESKPGGQKAGDAAARRFSSLDAGWRKVDKLHPRKVLKLHSHLVVRKLPSYKVYDGPDLGFALRVELVRRIAGDLGHRPETFLIKLRDEFKWRPAETPSLSNLDALMKPTSFIKAFPKPVWAQEQLGEMRGENTQSDRAWNMLTYYVSELCVLWLNAQPFARGKPPISAWEFRSQRFEGKRAVERFREWIRFDETRKQPFLPRSGFKLSEKSGRQKLIADVKNWIFSPAEIDDLVRHIPSLGMPRGLSALAGHLVTEIEMECISSGDERRYLYLPLGALSEARPSDAEGDSVARAEAASRQDLSPRTPFQGGLPEIVSYLRHFYTKNLDTFEVRHGMDPEGAFAEVLSEIRLHMIRRPRILILDGINATPGGRNCLRDIERFVAGDTLLGVLSRIMDFPLSAIDSPEDLESLKRNRILVLSNAVEGIAKTSDRSLRRWSLPFMSVDTFGHKFVGPDDGDWPDIIAKHQLKQKASVLAFRDKCENVRRNFGDLEYAALDIAYSAQGLLTSDNAGRSAGESDLWKVIEHHDPDTEPYYAAILRHALDRISGQHPLFERLLFFMTLAPDGIRQDTIEQLVETLLLRQMDDSPITKDMIAKFLAVIPKKDRPSQQGLSEAVPKALEIMLRELGSLVKKGAGDFFPGFDTTPDGLELYLSEEAWHRAKSARVPQTHCFTFPEFRDVARIHLAKRLGEPSYRISCRLLAMEYLNQQAIAFRHSGIDETQMLRPWRRQIGAILIGLQSLPIDCSDPERPAISEELDDRFSDQPVQMNTSRKFFRWLYFFAYRRQIERPPAHNMTRLYGVNGLKADLLRSFESPWLLWSDIFPCSAGKKTSLFPKEFPIGGCDRIECDRSRKIRLSHAVSVISAESEIDGKARLSDAQREMETIACSKSERLSAMKRTLDLAILRLWQKAEIKESVFKLARYENAPKKRVFQLALYEIAPPEPTLLRLLLGIEAEKKISDAVAAAAKDWIGHLHGGAVGRASRVATLARVVEEMLPDISTTWGRHFSEPGGTADLADILFRISEQISSTAEMSGVEIFPEKKHHWDQDAMLKAIPDRVRFMDRAEIKTVDAVVACLCYSLALAQFANQLRLKSFERSPVSASFFASSHSIRESVRVAIRLENIRRVILPKSTWRISGKYPARNPPLVDVAREATTTLSRHVFRYPNERASILTLEARMLRILIRNPVMTIPGTSEFEEDCRTRREALMTCREYLQKAETPLLALGHRSRRRLRLTLERLKVHRELAELAALENDAAQARFFLTLAELDTVLLVRTYPLNTPALWSKIANAQKARLEKTRGKVEDAEGREARGGPGISTSLPPC
ncbi:hypothetical protein RGUI_4338 (plasmid) [Rhodovulum sp. P5]|uniref:hypothetical protein n=1 Tax=Rhodovulum sp. P5 TaxID=1564506 RepID=UPI0009C28163|nr:hypothetical protein [Rhodovulum sp. P5]ARE42364.1 hypothetical protein RGUI_4338 [Rhodovulum sp. P5]